MIATEPGDSPRCLRLTGEQIDPNYDEATSRTPRTYSRLYYYRWLGGGGRRRIVDGGRKKKYSDDAALQCNGHTLSVL